jgi:glycosyltransferase involved in cell wall biosynthesis
MKILQALPGGMRFESGMANSIELCVSEWIAGSRYRQCTSVLAEPGRSPLLDVDVQRRASVRRLKSVSIAYSIRRLVKARGYELIASQQHVTTAALIAVLNRGVPVVLQTHNFIDPPVRGAGAGIKNRLRAWEFGQLAGMTLISEATLRQFERDWPQVRIPREVISNGFDFQSWTPAAEREKTVLVVARTHPTKGLLEAAEGLRTFLKDFADWRTAFILSDTKSHPDYFGDVVNALRPCGSQAEVLTGLPFSEVQRRTEAAAMSLVASTWAEPFGRVALEAHAGGAALISSGTGGLREISGDAAWYLPTVSGAEIAAALQRLAGDEKLRKELAHRGSERVRRLFRLCDAADDRGRFDTASVCERLDNFFSGIYQARGTGQSSSGRPVAPPRDR